MKLKHERISGLLVHQGCMPLWATPSYCLVTSSQDASGSFKTDNI